VNEGHVRWQGRAVATGEVPRVRSQAVYLHQRPALVEGTVEYNLRLPYSLHASRRHQFNPRMVLKLLSVLGRGDEFLSQTDHNLSGGERQIVAVVRALQLEPSVLLLDEPTAALDREAARAIERLILNWQREKTAERAFVWVSHSHEQIKRIASRIVSMHDGRLVEGDDAK